MYSCICCINDVVCNMNMVHGWRAHVVGCHTAATHWSVEENNYIYFSTVLKYNFEVLVLQYFHLCYFHFGISEGNTFYSIFTWPLILPTFHVKVLHQPIKIQCNVETNTGFQHFGFSPLYMKVACTWGFLSCFHHLELSPVLPKTALPYRHLRCFHSNKK